MLALTEANEMHFPENECHESFPLIAVFTLHLHPFIINLIMICHSDLPEFVVSIQSRAEISAKRHYLHLDERAIVVLAAILLPIVSH